MSKWTHAICDECWNKREPGRTPTRLKEEVRREEKCCFCGVQHKSGIFVREDPAETLCMGEGGTHNE